MRTHRKRGAKLQPGIRSGGQERMRGFTLIELAIVLVIIALLVGGVLIGRSLISAAGIRATVAQIEKYNTAVNSFRMKYNGLPGDLSSANAAAVGFISRWGSMGRGDNNGLIEGVNAGVRINQVYTQESGFFWNDLSNANMVEGKFQSDADNSTVTAVAAFQSILERYFPKAIRGSYVHVGSTGGLNYYLIINILGMESNTGIMTIAAQLTPNDLYNIDKKLDDGAPLAGTVQARGTAGNSATPMTDLPSRNVAPTIGVCTQGTGVATDTYNLSLTQGGSTPACIGRFRFN